MNEYNSNSRTCERCGRAFRPKKTYYRYCERCLKYTQPVGFTSVSKHRKGANHKHGGESRLYDGRRTVTLRGDKTRKTILAGMKKFLTEMYGKSTGISTLLLKNGMSEEEIGQLNNNRLLNNFVMTFCPELDKWLKNNYGHRFANVLIDYYGLYGDNPVSLNALAKQWGFNDLVHAQNYLGSAMKKLKEAESAFEQIVFQSAQTTLERNN